MSKNIINNSTIHKNFDLFGRILSIENGSLYTLVELEYQDVTKEDSSTSYNEKSVFQDDFSECTLDMVNDTKFNLIYSIFQSKPICIEIFQYENFYNLGEKEFNKIYFCDDINSELDIVENKSTRSLHFVDWETIVESSTIPEHTKFYDKLPIDNSQDPPKKYKPEDFNFIKFSKKYFHEIMYALYDKNIDNPVHRNQGKSHDSEQSTRRPVGYNKLIINNHNTDVLLTINEKKERTLYEHRQSLSKKLSKKGYKNVHQTQLKIIKNKITVYYNTFEKIVINNYFSENVISFQKHEYDSKEGIKSVLVQDSNEESTKFLNRFSDSRTNEWKYFEGLEEVSGDSGDEDNPIPPSSPDYMIPLEEKGDEDIESGQDNIITEIEINPLDYKFFQNIHCGQIIELTNFGTIYDGEYRVDEISAVVDKTYTSYSFDKLSKI